MVSLNDTRNKNDVRVYIYLEETNVVSILTEALSA